MAIKDFIAQMQGSKAFVKAKADAFAIGKVHLSFVAHSGKPECVQEAVVEGYLDFKDATQLYYLCMSGDIKLRYSRSIKKQQETQAKYADPIWNYNGGSNAKYDQAGNLVKPCRYYEISVSPGSKAEIAFQAKEGDGEVTETGGFMLKKGSTLKRVNVPFNFVDFCSFIVTIHDAVTAYQVYRLQVGINAIEENEYTPYKHDNVQPVPIQQTVPASAPAPVAAPAAVPVPPIAPAPVPVAPVPVPKSDRIWIFCDSSEYGIMGAASTTEDAINMARECFKKLKACQYQYVCSDKTIAARLQDEIRDTKRDFGYLTPVQMTSKIGLKSDRTGSTGNVLNVMVCPNGSIAD